MFKRKEFISKYSNSLKFVAVFTFLFLAYKAMFFFIWRSDYLFSLYYDFSIWWINGLLVSSDFFLRLVGYSTEVIELTRIVKISGTSGVTVGEPCIGFDIMALFVGLIVSATMKASRKLIFIGMALLIINALNILRISALAVLVQFDPYLWELNHKFIFTIVVYLVMFSFWRKLLKPSTQVVS